MTTRIAERTTHLPGSPASAWHAVMSPDIAPIIDPGVREWRPDREPIDVGTRFTIRGRVGVLPIRGTSECVRWDPPSVAVFVSVKPSALVKVTATHMFEPDGDGTRYTWRMEFTGPLPVVAFGARVFPRSMAAQASALTAYLDAQV
jgi:hypothetical protein